MLFLSQQDLGLCAISACPVHTMQENDNKCVIVVQKIVMRL